MTDQNDNIVHNNRQNKRNLFRHTILFSFNISTYTVTIT